MQAILDFFNAIYQSILTVVSAAGAKNGKIGEVVTILRDMFAGGKKDE